MAEYLIQEETLQGIGDKIRVLMGTEDTMTPAEMQNDLDTHNTEMNLVLSTQDDLIEQITTTLSRKIPENLRDELDTQDDLIALIAAALEGKMGASGGGSCIATGNTDLIQSGQDINGNTIFLNDSPDMTTINLSNYVGEIVSIAISSKYTLDIVIEEYGISIPVTSDLATYAVGTISYYFVVPNHNIVINLTQ